MMSVTPACSFSLSLFLFLYIYIFYLFIGLFAGQIKLSSKIIQSKDIQIVAVKACIFEMLSFQFCVVISVIYYSSS